MAAEMQSFMWKFIQLTNLGYDANLDVKSNDGKIKVCLQVELNDVQGNFLDRADVQTVYPSHTVPHKSISNARSRRRQLRRKRNAFKDAQIFTSVAKVGSLTSKQPIHNSCSDTEEVSTDAKNELASPLPMEPVTPPSKILSTQNVEATTIPFQWTPSPSQITLHEKSSIQPVLPLFSHSNPSAPSQCPECQKVFDTIDDYKWHYNTKYGREHCHILQSM